MSASVPSCHGLFRRIGVGGAADDIAADDGSSGEVVSVVSVAVREVGKCGCERVGSCGVGDVNLSCCIGKWMSHAGQIFWRFRDV